MRKLPPFVSPVGQDYPKPEPEARMSTSNWAVIIALLFLGIVAAVWADKGSWLNAVATGACNACPAPPQCSGSYSGHYTGSTGRYGHARGALPSIDGCKPTWWRRHF
jgi:hypothetical protein